MAPLLDAAAISLRRLDTYQAFRNDLEGNV